MDYGNAVRNNIAQQVVNPPAGFNPKPAVGLSPQAAANEQERYDKSFKEEPKARETIGISNAEITMNRTRRITRGTEA